MKLGRKKSPIDRRTLQLTAYLDVKAMPAPPLARPWSRIGGNLDGAVIPISMFANNVLGDCTCAALAHQDQLAAAQTGQTSSLYDDDVIALYRGSGYDPHDPSTDQGWNNLDAARAARKAGWIEGFAAFDPCNQWLLKIVINEFGFAYIGLDLPNSAKAQMGGVWDVAPAGKWNESYERNSWGGHAAGVVDFDHDGVTIATWGSFQRATWSFVFTYFDEGIAPLNRRWASSALAPSGVRIDELRADVARLNGAR